MSLPISPKQVRNRRSSDRKLSASEIEAINELIVRFWNGRVASVPWLSIAARASPDEGIDAIDVEREYSRYGWEIDLKYKDASHYPGSAMQPEIATIVFEPKKGL